MNLFLTQSDGEGHSVEIYGIFDTHEKAMGAMPKRFKYNYKNSGNWTQSDCNNSSDINYEEYCCIIELELNKQIEE